MNRAGGVKGAACAQQGNAIVHPFALYITQQKQSGNSAQLLSCVLAAGDGDKRHPVQLASGCAARMLTLRSAPVGGTDDEHCLLGVHAIHLSQQLRKQRARVSSGEG